MFLLPYSELETCYQLDAWETVRKLYILPLFSNTPAKLIFTYKTTLAMYFVCNVRKHHTFRRNTEEKIYRREVQSRRRDYFTSLGILIKQSNSWESSLIHLETDRMWVRIQQSLGELEGHRRQRPFETKKMPGVDIGYITSWRAFTRSVSSTCEYHAAQTSVCRWNHGICGNLGFHELQQRWFVQHGSKYAVYINFNWFHDNQG